MVHLFWCKWCCISFSYINSEWNYFRWHALSTGLTEKKRWEIQKYLSLDDNLVMFKMWCAHFSYQLVSYITTTTPKDYSFLEIHEFVSANHCSQCLNGHSMAKSDWNSRSYSVSELKCLQYRSIHKKNYAFLRQSDYATSQSIYHLLSRLPKTFYIIENGRLFMLEKTETFIHHFSMKEYLFSILWSLTPMSSCYGCH